MLTVSQDQYVFLKLLVDKGNQFRENLTAEQQFTAEKLKEFGLVKINKTENIVKLRRGFKKFWKDGHVTCVSTSV